MYKCNECGNIFEDGEQATWEEDRGEFWGFPCSEQMSGCPLCMGAYEKIEPCMVCGTYDHDVKDEFCNHCRSNIITRYTRLINDNFTEEERKVIDILTNEGAL